MKNDNRRLFTLILCALVCTLLPWLIAPRIASANGGTPVYSGDQGPYNAIISATPWPANPGTLHLSMVVTRAHSSDPVAGATVIYTNEMPGMQMADAKPVRAYQGSRPNIYDVDIPLSMDGQWKVSVQISGPMGEAEIPLTISVEKPSPPWGLIVGLLVGLPLLAGGSWYFLFRKGADEEDE